MPFHLYFFQGGPSPAWASFISVQSPLCRRHKAVISAARAGEFRLRRNDWNHRQMSSARREKRAISHARAQWAWRPGRMRRWKVGTDCRVVGCQPPPLFPPFTRQWKCRNLKLSRVQTARRLYSDSPAHHLPLPLRPTVISDLGGV